MNFLYFVPNTRTGDAIRQAGISDLLEPGKVASRTVFKGPDDLSGMMFYSGEAIDCNYKPQEQTWLKSNSGLFFIGYYKSSPPTILELKRTVQISGYPIELRNGESWLVPLARIFPNGTRLPQSLVLGSKGEVIKEILPQYATFSMKCEKFWKDFEISMGLTSGEPQMTEVEAIELAAEALNLNYRINIDGINAIKLFTTQNIGEILAMIVDSPTVIEKLSNFVIENGEKKNISIPGPSGSGQAEN